MRLLCLHVSGPKPAITHPITFPVIYFSRGDRECRQNLQSEEKTTTFKLPQSTWGMRSYMKQEYTSSGAVRKTGVWVMENGKSSEATWEFDLRSKVYERRQRRGEWWGRACGEMEFSQKSSKCTRWSALCGQGWSIVLVALVCLCVWVIVGGGEVNWSGGLGGNKIYVWVASVLSLQQLKVTPDLGLEMLFNLTPQKQKEFVNSPPTFEEMSLALCQMSVTQIWCYRGHRAQTLAV